MSLLLAAKSKFDRKKIRRDAPADTVILYQFGRGPSAPSASPYPLKLETFLRITKIPYETELNGIMSKKGKIPWISYNGQEVADSNLCIEFLKEKLGDVADLNKNLSEEQKALGHAILKLAEDSLYWVGLVMRWQYGDKDQAAFMKQTLGINSLVYSVAKSRFKDQTQNQGIGRHTKDEVIALGLKDLKALSTLLGDKPYFLGNEVSEVDCAVFGQCGQVKWHSTVPAFTKFFDEEGKNLSEFCDRMKEAYWPDWEDCLAKSAKKEEKKGEEAAADKKEETKEGDAKEEAPKEDAAKENGEKEDAPKENVEKEDAPKENGEKEDAPEEKGEKEDAPKENGSSEPEKEAVKAE